MKVLNIMEAFTGTIIEESLKDESVLNTVKIVSTKISPVTDKHKTPWLKQWTLHKVDIESDHAEKIAEIISKSIDKKYWYADFKNDNTHYIIFSDKIFKINRTDRKEYQKATDYGLALGIPKYQLDFLKDWAKS